MPLCTQLSESMAFSRARWHPFLCCFAILVFKFETLLSCEWLAVNADRIFEIRAVGGVCANFPLQRNGAHRRRRLMDYKGSGFGDHDLTLRANANKRLIISWLKSESIVS